MNDDSRAFERPSLQSPTAPGRRPRRAFAAPRELFVIEAAEPLPAAAQPKRLWVAKDDRYWRVVAYRADADNKQLQPVLTPRGVTFEACGVWRIASYTVLNALERELGETLISATGPAMRHWTYSSEPWLL